MTVLYIVREACSEVHFLASWLSGRAYIYEGREKVVKIVSSLDCISHLRDLHHGLDGTPA
jgi:hypothetical protein